MDLKLLFISVVLLFILSIFQLSEGAHRRCFACRSRSELGSCKDPFIFNVTQAEVESGVEVQPCASGWCGKILETENALKEEYGDATQRMCLQRGPSDGEDRCAYTMWNRKRVYMCFCQGDICNGAITQRSSAKLAVIISLGFFTALHFFSISNR